MNIGVEAKMGRRKEVAIKISQKVTQTEGMTRGRALRWEARMSLECLRKRKGQWGWKIMSEVGK